MLLTFFLGSIVIFLLSNAIPQDSIDVKLTNLNLSEDNDNYQSEYVKYYMEENKHLPLFYFSVLPSHFHPNIHGFVQKKSRDLLRELQDSSYDCSALASLANIDKSTLHKTGFHYPKFVFHGLQNQYHLYIKDFFAGHMGLSKKDGKPVSEKIYAAVHWTLSIVVINFILGIGLSWIIAFYLVKYNGHKAEKIFSGLTLILYAIPGFWLATLVLVFFTGDQYGMPIFYSPLFVDVDEQSFISVLSKGFSKIAPCVFCLTLLDIAYLTRLLKSNLLEQLEQPYALALKSRGLSMTSIIKDHACQNVMIPFVTLVVGSLPLALAGSLIFEIIFNVPGVGRLLYDSIYGADWKVVYAIVLLVLILTVVLYSVAEWVYRRLDPRI